MYVTSSVGERKYVTMLMAGNVRRLMIEALPVRKKDEERFEMDHSWLLFVLCLQL